MATDQRAKGKGRRRPRKKPEMRQFVNKKSFVNRRKREVGRYLRRKNKE